MKLLPNNKEDDLRELIIFENLVLDEKNYSHKIKGLSDLVCVSRPLKDPFAMQDITTYFENINSDLLNLLPIKERYAFKCIKNYYTLNGGDTLPLTCMFPVETIISNSVGYINVNWTSIIYLSIPGIPDKFPIHLNYNMRVPDCYPYLPMGRLDQLFDSLSVSSSMISYLDYVEMADYDKNDLPDIVYYNDKSERKIISGDTSAEDYFAAINDLYIQEICKVLISRQESINTVYRQEVFNILRNHIIQSFKTCMVALLKRSVPLVIPSSERLCVLQCGKTHQRRKFKYEDTKGEIVCFGLNSVRPPDSGVLLTIEWVEYIVNEQRFIRIIERPVSKRSNFGSTVTQYELKCSRN